MAYFSLYRDEFFFKEPGPILPQTWKGSLKDFENRI